jgi:hypothetical protein
MVDAPPRLVDFVAIGWLLVLQPLLRCREYFSRPHRKNRERIWQRFATGHFLMFRPIWRLRKLGGTAFVGSPADFSKLIADETEKWGKVIRAANIKPE